MVWIMVFFCINILYLSYEVALIYVFVIILGHLRNKNESNIYIYNKSDTDTQKSDTFVESDKKSSNDKWDIKHKEKFDDKYNYCTDYNMNNDDNEIHFNKSVYVDDINKYSCEDDFSYYNSNYVASQKANINNQNKICREKEFCTESISSDNDVNDEIILNNAYDIENDLYEDYFCDTDFFYINSSEEYDDSTLTDDYEYYNDDGNNCFEDDYDEKCDENRLFDFFITDSCTSGEDLTCYYNGEGLPYTYWDDENVSGGPFCGV